MLFDFDEISDLEAEIKRHNDLYWNDNNPEISDAEYDGLVERLRALNPDSSLLKSVSPIKDGQVRHLVPMLSLDKCYDDEGLGKWSNTLPAGSKIVVSPKIDGIACSIVYNAEGEISRVSTRGDGVKGEEISLNAISTFKDIPYRIPALGSEIEVRGEIYMSLNAFRSKTGVVSPRNSCAGAIKRKSNENLHAFGLRFFAYDVFAHNLELDTGFTDALSRAYSWGFNPVPHSVYQITDKEGLEREYERVCEVKHTFDYDIDGVVYRVDDRDVFKRLGSTSHHPRGAIAYKLQGDSAQTILKDVEWSVSRNGILTPVALIEPVFLNGASVSRVTLHNLAQMREKNINTLNAKVKVSRRGGVIPHFEGVIEQGDQPLNLPVSCPICPKKCARTLERDGILLCDGDLSCDPISAQVLDHYVKATKIDGFGDVWLEKLTNMGILKSPVDLYLLNERALQGIEGVKEGRTSAWLSSIEKARKVPLDVFLRSLSINGLGKSASAVLAEKYESLDKILSSNQQATFEGDEIMSSLCYDLSKIDGFGKITADAISEGLEKRADLITALLEHIEVLDHVKPKQLSDKLSGQSFVFTGTLTTMKRADAQKKVISLGGSCPSSVNKDLTYLVIGNEGKAGSKLAKAEKLGVKILPEDDFFSMIGD